MIILSTKTALNLAFIAVLGGRIYRFLYGNEPKFNCNVAKQATVHVRKILDESPESGNFQLRFSMRFLDISTTNTYPCGLQVTAVEVERVSRLK